ncbi:MAG: RND family efflux transporter MFP subunit [Myxococcota bacterium]|jgi:RND family efflux transporter MFP subunit
MNRYITGCLIPGVLVFLSVAVLAVLMFGLPERSVPEPLAAIPQVDVVAVVVRDVPIQIYASGTVRPSTQVTVIPEVSGRVVWQKPGLRAGSQLGAGEVFARIDNTPYQAQVAADRQRVLQAKLELSLEEGRQAVSEREFEILRPGGDREASPLTLRGPQLELARAAVTTAEAALAQSQRSLARTRLSVPFRSVVLSETLDIGQVVGMNSAVATLAGTASADVLVDLTLDEVGYLRIPGVTDGEASTATISQMVGGQPLTRQGRVMQLLGQLDPQTRRAQVLVEVPEPTAGGLPLQPNAFVDVALAGITLNDSVTLPPEAVEDGNKVWIVDAEDTLQRRTVEVAWRLPEAVVLRGGLEAGDRVVVSPLVFPVEGQTVTVGGA